MRGLCIERSMHSHISPRVHVASKISTHMAEHISNSDGVNVLIIL